MHDGVLASSAPDGGELIGEVDIVLPGEPGNLQVRAMRLEFMPAPAPNAVQPGTLRPS